MRLLCKNFISKRRIYIFSLVLPSLLLAVTEHCKEFTPLHLCCLLPPSLSPSVYFFLFLFFWVRSSVTQSEVYSLMWSSHVFHIFTVSNNFSSVWVRGAGSLTGTGSYTGNRIEKKMNEFLQKEHLGVLQFPFLLTSHYLHVTFCLTFDIYRYLLESFSEHKLNWFTL